MKQKILNKLNLGEDHERECKLATGSVKQGQRIGTVAAPTKYGVALGEHLIFAMEKNGEPQNPMEKMKTAE